MPAIIYTIIYYPGGFTKQRKTEVIDHIHDTTSSCLKKCSNTETLIHRDFTNLDITEINQTFELDQLITFPSRGNATLDLMTNVTEYKQVTIIKLAPIGANDYCVIEIAASTELGSKYMNEAWSLKKRNHSSHKIYTKLPGRSEHHY